MSNPAAGDFNIGVRTHRAKLLLFIAFYTATGLSALAPIVDAWAAKAYLPAFAYSFFMLAMVLLAIMLIPKDPKSKDLTKVIFSGVGGVSEENFIPREEEVESILGSLLATPRRPVFVVGPSGAGKSVIVAQSVSRRMVNEHNYTVCTVSEYDDGEDSIKSSHYEALQRCGIDVQPDALFDSAEIVPHGGDRKMLLVFDQFEQFLEQENSKAHRGPVHSKAAREWFGTLVSKATLNENLLVLIVVRKEWYYDLRFLRDHVPPPYQTCHLSGVNIRDNAGGRELMKRALNKITRDPATTDFIVSMLAVNNEIVLMEYQIVGLVIENECAAAGGLSIREFRSKYGSMDAVIKKYFLLYLDISADRALSLKVLFAMSQQRRLKSLHSVEQIAAMVHESSQEVEACLAFFKKTGLVRSAPRGYELAHDYLADRYHEISGQELDPVERDNIVYFSEEFARGQDLELTRNVRVKIEVIASTALLSCALIWRLLDPMFGSHLSTFTGAKTAPNLIMDFLFLPVFVAHGLWSSYILLLYHRLFVPVDQTGTDRLLSIAVLLTCVFGVFVAVVYPPGWLLSISVAGLMVGWKFMSLSSRPCSGSVARAHFRSHGMMTIFNCLFVGFFGCASIAFAASLDREPGFLEYYAAAIFMFSLMMSYYRIVVTPQHITKTAISKMIGLLDRGRVSDRGGHWHAGC